MKKLCLILTVLVQSTLAFSQVLHDSVIFYVDNRVEVKVAMHDFNELKSTNNVTAALEEFNTIIPQLKEQLSPESADLVRYSLGGSVSVEAGDSKTVYLNKAGEFTNTGVRDEAIITGEAFKIFITAADISNIPDISLTACLEQVIAILPEKTRWSKSLYYECVNGTVKALEDQNNELDFLEINLGVGAGLVRNTWVPDVSLGVGIGFRHKGTIRFPYVSTNLLFAFDAEAKTRINTFLNLGYGWDISKKSKKKDLLGMEIGYLVSRQGDLFGKNTFKVGANWSPVKGVYVNPHLYITDNFSTLFPGIRIGFGF